MTHGNFLSVAMFSVVQLGCGLVTVEDIVYESHDFHTFFLIFVTSLYVSYVAKDVISNLFPPMWTLSLSQTHDS